ncbi:ribosome maturation factor RimM [Clostridia bacterium]|nr:ribosome maturation factor RimM [Clostridia bacterium]
MPSNGEPQRDSNLTPYLAVGRVSRAHGIRGQVRIEPCTDDPARFGILTVVFLKVGDEYQPRCVTSAQVSGSIVRLALEGVTDRDQAEALRGQWLYVDRANAFKNDPGAEFICDIIGCEVYDSQGEFIGTVRDVLQPGGNDVYEIETANGLAMVPALAHVVTAVDIAARRITIDRERMLETSVFENHAD